MDTNSTRVIIFLGPRRATIRYRPNISLEKVSWKNPENIDFRDTLKEKNAGMGRYRLEESTSV